MMIPLRTVQDFIIGFCIGHVILAMLRPEDSETHVAIIISVVIFTVLVHIYEWLARKYDDNHQV